MSSRYIRRLNSGLLWLASSGQLTTVVTIVGCVIVIVVFCIGSLLPAQLITDSPSNRLPNGHQVKAGDSWQLEIWKRADHWPVAQPPWIVMQVLEFEIITIRPKGGFDVRIMRSDRQPIFANASALDLAYDGEENLVSATSHPDLKDVFFYMLLKRPGFLIPKHGNMQRGRVADPTSGATVEGLVGCSSPGVCQVWGERDQPWWSFFSDRDSSTVAKIKSYNKGSNR